MMNKSLFEKKNWSHKYHFSIAISHQKLVDHEMKVWRWDLKVYEVPSNVGLFYTNLNLVELQRLRWETKEKA